MIWKVLYGGGDSIGAEGKKYRTQKLNKAVTNAKYIIRKIDVTF